MNDARLQVLAGSQDTVRLFMATNQYLAAALCRWSTTFQAIWALIGELPSYNSRMASTTG